MRSPGNQKKGLDDNENSNVFLFLKRTEQNCVRLTESERDGQSMVYSVLVVFV